MPKIHVLEPIIEEILITNPESRKDDFIVLYEVLKKFVDTDLPLRYVFKMHKELGVPSLESITRCRRKIQERHIELKYRPTVEIREKEEKAFVDLALGDKQWY